jgi:protein-L-isoaspartate(D-aspartate) O-methyltransferase
MENRDLTFSETAQIFARSFNHNASRMRPLILAFALGLSACSGLSGIAPLPTEPPLPTGTQPPIQTPTPTPTFSPTSSTLTPVPNEAPAFDITTRAGPSIKDKTAYIQWMQANTPELQPYLDAKWKREQDIVTYDVATDPRIIQAFLIDPREDFFDAGDAALAYSSAVFPIGYGQTIPGPFLVAHMVQAIDPQPNQKVLEIGTGSGYTSALLAELTNHVYTMEIVPQLAQKDDALYTELATSYPEYANIKRVNADGYYGWAQYAPFDRIIVTAGIDHVPPDLLAQLAPGGIMVIPVGPPSGETVLKITKQVQPDGSFTFLREDIYHGLKIRFVPFTGVP